MNDVKISTVTKASHLAKAYTIYFKVLCNLSILSINFFYNLLCNFLVILWHIFHEHLHVFFIWNLIKVIFLVYILSSLFISFMCCFNVFCKVFVAFCLNCTSFTRSYMSFSKFLSSPKLGAGLVILHPMVSYLMLLEWFIKWNNRQLRFVMKTLTLFKWVEGCSWMSS